MKRDRFIHGLYQGFMDFRDWDGLDNPQQNGGAKAGYVTGAIIRVLLLLAMGAGIMTML